MSELCLAYEAHTAFCSDIQPTQTGLAGSEVLICSVCVQSLRLYTSSLHIRGRECWPQAATQGGLIFTLLGRHTPWRYIVLMHRAAGDKKSGSVRVLYDSTWSTRGVVQTVGRKPRAKNLFDFQVISVLCPFS